ncbi:hypothetical protein AAJ76_4400020519 [Vairimorpha ceranae]|uniref:Uncharacterized protein n=1 Tax=Vairimorpha ceranae TaxID=40302 RepID=A0A0F9WP96_9MICR|nr:hypothetical protein AAJ76_4400020519 [Vairimorpha ceranae]KKO74808.1 hypothetical protein AAJ76_4400020519 [Vairimorpha ceranae]
MTFKFKLCLIFLYTKLLSSLIALNTVDFNTKKSKSALTLEIFMALLEPILYIFFIVPKERTFSCLFH